MSKKQIDVRLAVDVGGTFTDIVLNTPNTQTTAKVLTTTSSPEEAVIAGANEVFASAGIDPASVDLVLHGTTLATNAILERKGAVTALITTEGFRDVLEIGYETRYDQYNIFLEKVTPLIPRDRRLCLSERIDINGRVILDLDELAIPELVPHLTAAGVESIAIGFLHAYANPVHEQTVARTLGGLLPDIPITLSSEVCPEIREYERLSTAAANAYVRPAMEGYLSRLEIGLQALGLTCPVRMMTSSGGLTTLETAKQQPIRLVESGPAGGAILARDLAVELGLDRVISFDMGGTTAKISLIEDFEPGKAREFEVDRQAHFRKGSGLPLRIPVIEMVEIGAGGGSIARIDGTGRVTIGPDSAGADPGPAAYGQGGTQPTITDADIVLGKVDTEQFAGGKLSLDYDAAAKALNTNIGKSQGLTTQMSAFAVNEMVDETMANAVRVHTVEKGHDVAEHSVIAFGGAAPLHVARLVDKLGIDCFIIPENAGVGSAVGFLQAPISYEVVRSLHMSLDNLDRTRIDRIFDEMREEALAVVQAGAGDSPLTEARSAFMRYRGQGHEISVPISGDTFDELTLSALKSNFDKQYAVLFRRTLPNAEIEVLTWALTISTSTQSLVTGKSDYTPTPAVAVGERQVFDAETNSNLHAQIYNRNTLQPGSTLTGPAIVVESQTSTFVPDGFRLHVSAGGHLVVKRDTGH
ncbi:MAG TPA: hydantoinase/oxoprolinase family protein [Arenicellales bacterium]|nr:hydantoinase/oxoprolinase family protein [Arenicellales bacterium]